MPGNEQIKRQKKKKKCKWLGFSQQMERRFTAISASAPFENTGSKDVFNTCMQNESTVVHIK